MHISLKPELAAAAHLGGFALKVGTAALFIPHLVAPQVAIPLWIAAEAAQALGVRGLIVPLKPPV